jgi:NADP-reducing hydrogenase subunit HndC
MAWKVDTERCLGCRICASKCPLNLLETNKEFKIVMINEGCTGCGLCAEACPYQYITLE